MSEMPPATPSASGMQPHRGVLVLILGILSFFICGIIMGPIAFFLGKGDLAKMDAGAMDPEGRQMTKIGMICGAIAAILNLIFIVLYVILMIIGGVAAAAS